MIDRFQTLTREELSLIHDASMDILANTGICFNHDSALKLFKDRGFKTEGNRVFMTEEQIYRALKSTRSRFTIHARNPEKSVSVGEDDYVCLPTGGAPNIACPDGTQRPGTLKDFIDCCKLIQTSDQVDMGGYLMVQPTDIPCETAHLDMMAGYMTLCDKPIFGASASGRAASDTLELAARIFGGREKLKERPVVAAVVDAMSPLQYTGEQTEVIMEMARYNQAVVVTDMILAGASGPVSLPSLLALGNAEILAGVLLTQLVNPGTPVVYGSTSSQMDMKTSTGPVGTPETVIIASATIQMARFYNLPSRTGGGLTDSHFPDAQAMAEASLMLSTVIRNGANFIYHAFGHMGSYISMSFEKWLLDEEVTANIRNILKPLIITPESIDADTIKEVGIGGQYLSHPTTFKGFRALSQPRLFNRKEFRQWEKQGGRRIDQVASDNLQQRLDTWTKPDLDPEIEASIMDYIEKRKNGEL
ncbi:trimethylamine methyltransferase family protein [Desulfospira joergensenii]|uniref:trimethylamine methyltransferase family protein n=1 Tax=Desulfospira joergensenii TaxID=53329 RepID=UPI0003B380C5|nr:trimethylamine methyltransferase family protein [Desulfospira joergensenii]